MLVIVPKRWRHAAVRSVGLMGVCAVLAAQPVVPVRTAHANPLVATTAIFTLIKAADDASKVVKGNLSYTSAVATCKSNPPADGQWLYGHSRPILKATVFVDGTPVTTAQFVVKYNFNGKELDQVRVELDSATTWTFGGSVLDAKFNIVECPSCMQNGVVGVMIYVTGTFDPSLEGDVSFSGAMVLHGDGDLGIAKGAAFTLTGGDDGYVQYGQSHNGGFEMWRP